MSSKINIAIDGHSSCGKSTIAKSIAIKYNMNYIDSGAMYRAFTLYCLKHKIINNQNIDHKKLTNCIKNIRINFSFSNESGVSKTILNNFDVEDKIRSEEVTKNVSIVSAVQIIRNKLIALQQEFTKKNNVVMDGRDIGSKVMPNADLKFFLTAKSEIRAQRRYEELLSKGLNVSYKNVLKNLNLRDKHDVSRSINPLRIAKNAIVIDNTNLSLNEQDEIIFREINKKINYADKY